ncbi:MAG TPA: protein kinase [Thermoanaerobaculia bacterium]|nr:protein kinase [Thermoanaerobaculia bacterium]
MDPRTESRVLRLAIAKGLLHWEDLDAVADRLPEREETAENTIGGARWLQALRASGRLDGTALDELAALAAELERDRDSLTPDLSGTALKLTSSRVVTPPPDALGLTELPLELRFLLGWERYRVESFLGAGGMGSVYKAFDPTLNRYVALKFLQWNDPTLAERFLHEARAQARVDHPNVCRVYEVGEVEGRPYIAMQYIEGRSLAELRDELSLEAKVRLVRDVARAVHAAHKNGLIHRDLKPGNILVEAGDDGGLHPYVVDFGLAREQDEQGLTRTGMLSGTPAYLAPEQAQGSSLDRRTDVYSLGVVLYELLTGTPPFMAPNAAAILVRLLQEEPEPPRKLRPNTPADLETLILKCLEKDPGRRYDSARALAEDLDRYLEGEPVQARPSGWGYRLGKKVRKNKALTAVVAAACLALAVMGAASLRAQWQAQERAELAQRFGQRVKDLEANMRYEALLPRHDTTARKADIRRELAAIRSEMVRLGPIAEGPGHYAIGRCYLALHQYETAREHLEKAWNAGHQTSEVASALGRALGFLYEKNLADVTRNQSKDLNQATRAEIESSYRKPALAFLKEGSGSAAESSPYLTGLIAFYEGRYPEALARARTAYREAPWFYEAAQLEAEVYAAEADDAAEVGRHAQAVQLYDRSGEIYRRLLASVPSDASLYASDCGRRARKIEAELAVRSLPEDQVRDALTLCDRALEVDPELSEALGQKARLLWRRGEQLFRSGEDPRPDLTAAIALCERAIAVNPKDALAYANMAIALRVLTIWDMERGMDPSAKLVRGIEAARKAVELQPERATNHSSVGSSYLALATHQQRRGIDPRRTLERAVASYNRATELNPTYAPAYTSLGNTWKMIAESQMAQGLDPTLSLSRAAGSLERSARLNPNSALVFNNLGNIYLTQAEYLLDRGSDPRQALEQAAASYRRAIAVKPDYLLGHYNLGYTQRSLALALLERGEDPAPALQAAEASLQEALRLNPADADSFLEQGRCDLVAARWAARQKRDPEPLLQKAGQALARAETLNPSGAEIFLTQAMAQRYRAEWELSQGRRPQQAIREGLSRIAKAQAINPEEARYLAMKGALHHLAARLETDPTRRSEQESQAVVALEKALKMNPLLKREYGAILAESQRQRKST